MTDRADPDLVSFRRALWILGSLFAVSAGLTLLYLGMRSVMDIGGACASGGPFVPIRPCPEGVPALMIGGIWVGLLAAFAYGAATIGSGIPSFVGLFWPALFISLGWNFLQYAFDPPFGDAPVWGWLIPGVLFQLMGVIPLYFWIRYVGFKQQAATRMRSVLAPPGGKAVADMIRTAVEKARSATPVMTTTNPTRPDLVSELERLDGLHRSGALSDTEYDKAKRRLLS